MRFTKLRLNGFKSFVDPTDLIIADGLTGVVGPNGCGKSNLLEALRWVMGENRPTAMRGGGMEDVIFAGASTRPARNFAEVGLVIDNSEHLAPAAFNDHDMLEIVRRITRDAGSAYKVAGKDVRARDVQMLFADASTGAHSPALVRQGQISELINAKPKARRRVLEEAAGISGLYQRRHEAELKLKGAEANLLRVDDVIEQLAGQLAQLARQARQAARYREIGTKLRHSEGLLLYRRWREAHAALSQMKEALRVQVTAAATAEREAVQAATTREASDGALPALREEEAISGAVLQRLQVEKGGLDAQAARALATIETLGARVEQLARDATREEALNRDAGETIAKLEAETAELVAAGDGYEADLAGAAEEARAAGAVLGDREGALAQLTEDVARLAARHQSARRMVDDSHVTLKRAETSANDARLAVASADGALQSAGAAFEAAAADRGAAEAAASEAEEALQQADEARGAAAAQEAEARAAQSASHGELEALRAEAGALAKMVARDTAEGGQVMDACRVDAGFEAAFGAALADDLRAPIVTSGSGWVALPGYVDGQALPENVGCLADHVAVPDTLGRRIAQVGIVAAEAGDILQADLKPGQRLVSVEGDLWRWDGFRAAAEDAPSAAALRLQQLNRLEALKHDINQAEARAAGAKQAHEVLQRQLADLTAADKAARDARRVADQRVAEVSRTLSRSEADRNIAAGKLESAQLAVARHEDEAMAARARLVDAEKAAEGLADLDGLRAQVEDVKLTVEAARMTMMARRSAHDELKREGEARQKRIAAVERELGNWRARLENAGTRLAELAARQTETEAELEAARAVPATLDAQRAKLDAGLAEAEARRQLAADALAQGENTQRAAATAERDAERRAGEAREARARAEAQSDAAREAVALAADRIDEALDVSPDQLLDMLDADPDKMPAAETIEAEVTRLKRQRDALGAVNLRAEEDAKEVAAEHDLLVSEKADLEEAISTLRSGIAGLNREGRERLLTAFEQVNANFGMLFTHLFGGGDARLELVESDDPLDAGLEILCQPPGKKLSTLSLLSGGEQTLTALALIFGVFLANPAPICVLDEVDAPLDDANVTRFCDMLDEMTRRTDTRFLTITHHAVTMARMDRLFGVTMGEQGVSQLVSVDLKAAETLVA